MAKIMCSPLLITFAYSREDKSQCFAYNDILRNYVFSISIEHLWDELEELLKMLLFFR